MSGSNRGDRTKAGLIFGSVTATLIAAAFISWGLGQSAEYQRQADNQTSEYARYTYAQKRHSCLLPSTLEKAKCIAEARHERRANERDEQDLVAQRQSALWAYIMGAAAIIGMGLSVIGVLLVWTTFRETKQSNIISHQHQRARLVPRLRFNDWPDHSGFDVVVTAENIGSTPATGVTVRTGIFSNPPETPPFHESEGYRHVIRVDDSENLASITRGEGIMVGSIIAGIVKYYTVFGGPHFSYFCFEISLRHSEAASARDLRAVPVMPESWPSDT